MARSVERLDAEDRLMQRWDDRWPQDIGVLLLLEGEPLRGRGGDIDIGLVRDVVESRLHLLPRFLRIVRTLGALFSGELMTRLMIEPILPLIANVSLGVGALSYAGAFNLCVVADYDAYPDLDGLVAGMHDELRTLAGVADPAPADALRLARRPSRSNPADGRQTGDSP